MANTPAVSVGAPDDLGLRKVIIDGKTAGKVWSPREFRRLLRRAGPAYGPDDIHWLGGDSAVWPDRAWRRRIVGTLMAAGLLTTASVLARIGMADTFDALTYGGRIAGVTFLVLALVEVLAALTTLDYWRKRRSTYSGVIILFGSLVAFGISSLLLTVQLCGRVYSGYLLLWTTLTLWSSWALCTLFRDRAWKGVHNPRRIAIGAFIPTLLAGANLTYSQFYVPYVTSPLVQTAAEFRTPSLNKDGTTMYLPIHVYVKNAGQVPVYILGSIFWIRGRPDGTERSKLIKADEFITPPGGALNPGEQFSLDSVIEIKNPEKSAIETVSAQTELYTIRKDRMTMNADYEFSKKFVGKLRKEGKERDPQGPAGEYYRYQSEISNSSEILNVTRGRQRVTMWWALRRERPYIHVDVAPPGVRRDFDLNNPDANKDSIDRYGLAKVRGPLAQMPFVELLEKAERSTR
ncbi:hypothetical protein ACGFYQ_28770 [Streptomyces sp. NPDC048258]|uniref:hypothetical protein n=1 Tax=Streptomyces sp. NPDC048258 TaxID=3365527 RepID=UPI0037168537